ncbi:CHASE2 domain-containing protein [Paenibacillus alkalitolerans]|uniref:CHASE2 domain-containing protein n=1 Tax=Paenibacillus alkalitolerans TaxID=2799335 RepID=UPI0018F69614|nr:adenylate/guanylate cyclase domain-containing protein [Paenibacillus alkalitolerans]
MKSIRLYALTVNAVVVALSLCLILLNVLEPLKNALYDFDLERTNSGAPDERIIVVAIDEYSIEAIGQFPWPREIYGALIESMNQSGTEPSVIGFDILFDTQSSPGSDAAFADALSRYDNVILPSTAVTENELSRTTTVEADGLIPAHDVIHPIPAFYENTHHAHINAVLDTDKVIRRTWLQLQTPEDGVLNSLAFQAAKMAGADVDHYLNYHPQTEIWIDYEAESYDFLTVPFVDVLNGNFPPENFKDAIVLVGFTAIGLSTDDIGSVPIETEMKLVYAHANIINQLLNNTYITYYPDWVVLVVSLVLLAAVVFITWRFKTVASLSAVLAGSIAIIAGQHYLFRGTNIFIDTVHPAAVMFLAYISNIAVKAYFETKHKNFITKQFGRYISPDLVKEIASSEQEIQLGGINKELSVLFLDIRGFTTLSEKLKPEEVVDFLNSMFNLITEKCLENKGTIDKFIGDAAMLMFNAPLDLPNHEYCAVKTAYDIQKGMEEVRRNIFEKFGVTVNVGIGINTGEVVVGNIGSYIRVDYTAIGDNVNIAARIESNTVAGQILVSETTYERTKDLFEYNCVGERMMKGKTVAVKLYEVLGLKNDAAAAEAAAGRQ